MRANPFSLGVLVPPFLLLTIWYKFQCLSIKLLPFVLLCFVLLWVFNTIVFLSLSAFLSTKTNGWSSGLGAVHTWVRLGSCVVLGLIAFKVLPFFCSMKREPRLFVGE